MLPFSIFDSIPAEMPAAAPSSDTVRSIDLRKRRTSNPILASSGRTEDPVGAREPVSKSASASRARTDRPFSVERGARRRLVLFPEPMPHLAIPQSFPVEKKLCL
jgi:hypothetical protein